MYVRVKWRDTPEELFVRAENCRLTLKQTAYFSEQRLTKNKSEKGQGLCAQLELWACIRRNQTNVRERVG